MLKSIANVTLNESAVYPNTHTHTHTHTHIIFKQLEQSMRQNTVIMRYYLHGFNGEREHTHRDIISPKWFCISTSLRI